MAVSITHSGHYSLWVTSPNPATGTPDLGFDLRAQQRHRDRHIHVYIQQPKNDLQNKKSQSSSQIAIL